MTFHRLPCFLWPALATAALCTALTSPVLATVDTLRSVYIYALDANGGLVTDLKASDLVVRENREERAIASLVPATERLNVAILVDDGGDGLMQGAVARLASALYGKAAMSISMLNPQPFRLNDYSTEVNVLGPAIAKLVERGRPPQDDLQVIDAISWAAKDLRKREFTRPVVVALVSSGEPGKSDIADFIINDLRDTGVALHVVHAGGVDMGRVLMDGPVRSGGSSTVANSSEAYINAMTHVARILSTQYKLTYTLPDGVKPREELAVTTTREGIKVVAPTRIPVK